MMAEKLEITPELQAGLDKGIRQRLQQLVTSGELTLKVEDKLQPLLEPESDSSWLDAREDIFRFFKEAIANVIRHAQPPNGTATKVTVSLFQEGTQCMLSVENDATGPVALALEWLKPEQNEVDIIRVEEPEEISIEESELDEMWSYVGSKKNPRWLWHALTAELVKS